MLVARPADPAEAVIVAGCVSFSRFFTGSGQRLAVGGWADGGFAAQSRAAGHRLPGAQGRAMAKTQDELPAVALSLAIPLTRATPRYKAPLEAKFSQGRLRQEREIFWGAVHRVPVARSGGIWVGRRPAPPALTRLPGRSRANRCGPIGGVVMVELSPEQAEALADLAEALGYMPEVVDITAVLLDPE